jgi:hypothetical protein
MTLDDLLVPVSVSLVNDRILRKAARLNQAGLESVKMVVLRDLDDASLREI